MQYRGIAGATGSAIVEQEALVARADGSCTIQTVLCGAQGNAVDADPTPLSDAELADWVAKELRKDVLRAQKRLQATRDKAWADKDAQQGARANAIIAGQQAIRRDLPYLLVGGGFSAAPAPQGGWIVRYVVDRADSNGAVPSGTVECVVAADGTAFVRKGPD